MTAIFTFFTAIKIAVILHWNWQYFLHFNHSVKPFLVFKVVKNVAILILKQKWFWGMKLDALGTKSLEIWYYSRLSHVVVSSPIPSHLFPGFFLDFHEPRDHKEVVLSRTCQFGNCPPVSSCLVSFKTSSETQTSKLFWIIFFTSFICIWLF